MSDADQDRRTVPPSARRAAELRRRGDIAISRDLSAAATMVGGVTTGLAFLRPSLGALWGFLARTLESVGGSDRWAERPLHRAAVTLVMATLPAAAGALAGYLVAAGLQLGWPPALVWPRFDWGRVFSPRSLAKIVSPRALAGRALRSLGKVSLVALAGALVVTGEVLRCEGEPALAVGAIGLRFAAAAIRLACYSGGALLALGLFDYFLARRAHATRLRMTPEEWRREQREEQGDPLLRRRRRQRMRELAGGGLPAATRDADVLVVDPGGLAVALRYRPPEEGVAGAAESGARSRASDRAPRVVAKGRDGAAGRMVRIARSGDVPVLLLPALARLLDERAPTGGAVPPSLYQEVAEALVGVPRFRGGMR